MPFYTTYSIQPGDAYPVIGIHFNASRQIFENKSMHKAVSGRNVLRSKTAIGYTPSIWNIKHTVSLADKRKLEEHYAANKTENFMLINTNAGINSRVKYLDKPRSTQLGGNYWTVDNTLEEYYL